MRTLKRAVPLFLALFMLAGCGQSGETIEFASSGSYIPDAVEDSAYVDMVAMDLVEIADEAVALSAAPAAMPLYLAAVPSGAKENRNGKAVIDYSNTADGYVMVQYTASTTKRLKVQVAGPTTTYTYNINPGAWVTFPLSDGNGSYKVSVFENVADNKFAVVISQAMDVVLTDEFGPFLRSNQYVDFEAAPNTIAKAQELAGSLSDPLQKVAAIYDFVVSNLTYDMQLAATVQSGYLPVLDSVLEKKTGICFDYAALMTGMLRSQGVPCKLVVGYAGDAYHAWISVWSSSTGWVDGAIYFDGAVWQRMDPTFASTSNKSSAIMAYIGDGNNYAAKYFY